MPPALIQGLKKEAGFQGNSEHCKSEDQAYHVYGGMVFQKTDTTIKKEHFPDPIR